MRDTILGLLNSTPQKAADIRKAIDGVTKSEVNQVLYALEKEGLAVRDSEFQWTRAGSDPLDAMMVAEEEEETEEPIPSMN